MDTPIKESIRMLRPYSVAKGPVKIRLDANENPFNLFALIKDDFLRRAAGMDLNRYPDSESEELSSALAQANGVSKDNIICGNGSDEIIQLILNAFVEPGDRVVIAPPTFSMYGVFASIAGAKVVEVPTLSDFSINTQAIIEQARERAAKVIFLCSPNNPTGTLLSRGDILEIVNETDGIVVLDEAYAEFCGESNLALALANPRVIVLRTLSKAFALAGARVGYGVGDKETISMLKRVKPPYNLNSFSQLAALIILENQVVVESAVQRIIGERERVISALRDIQGVTVFPSKANFLLIKVGPISSIVDQFQAKGIRVRTFVGQPVLEKYLRISIGSPAENDEIIQVLKGCGAE